MRVLHQFTQSVTTEMGYIGLYGVALWIKKKSLSQNSTPTPSELASDNFRITQTEEKIKKENIKGLGHLALTHYFVGSKVRKIIKEIGGTMPEDLPSESHIKRLSSKQKKELSS